METDCPCARVLRLACRILILGVVLVGGCTTTTSLDSTPAIKREQIIGRKYILDAGVYFYRAQTHFFLEFGADDLYGYGQLYLPKGTVVQIKHIESIKIEDIEGPLGRDQVQAIVQTGSHKGERILVGSITAFNSKYAKFEMDELPQYSRGALAPLPDNPPEWLEVNPPPPHVKPVPLEALMLVLHDPNWPIRFYALRELIRRHPSEKGTILACAAALQDDVSEVRALAIDALASDGVKSSLVVGALIGRLSDPLTLDSEAEGVSDAIVATGPAGMKGAAALLGSGDKQIVARAAGVLQRSGPNARAYIPELLEVLYQDPKWGDFFEYMPAYLAIREIDLDTALPIAIEVLQGKDTNARISAAWEMANLEIMAAGSGDLKARHAIVAALTKATGDPDGLVCEAAAGALQSIGK